MRRLVRGAGPCAALLALLLAVAAGPAAAQGTSGKLQGRVVDAQSGNPIVGAQVVVQGTRLGNITDQQGYYFVNNVPAGVYDIQAQYIGYQTTTVTGQRILANYTTTVNFQLSQQAVALEAITVQGESNPLVPRDKTVSAAIVTGDIVQQLPVDNPDAVVALQPGVTRLPDNSQFIIRGGRPGEASVYVDGVLVRNFNRGEQGNIDLGTNALEQVNVLTGGFGAEYGQAQSGIVNYVTKSGGARTSGALQFGTDQVFPNSERYGISRLEANIGGPLVKDRISYELALTAQGNEDRNPQFRDIVSPGGFAQQLYYFRPTGFQQLEDGDSTMGYQQITGLGPRTPWNNADQYSATAGLRFNLSDYTKLSLTAVKSRDQGLQFSSYYQFRPWAESAYRNNSDLYRAGLEQILFQNANSQAVLRINAAYQNDQSHSGLRADTTGLEPPGPDALGFRFSDYKFMFEGLKPEQFLSRLDSIRAGNSSVQTFFPAQTLTCGDASDAHPCSANEANLLFNPNATGPNNPYGIKGYSGFGANGFPGYYFSGEKTWSVDASLDVQAGRFNRLQGGVQYYKKDVQNISSTSQGNISVYNTTFQNVYHVKPTIGAAYIKDRLDLGEMVLDLGLRLDHYSSDAKFPVLPGLVFPFVPDSSTLQYCESPPSGGSLTCTPGQVSQKSLWNLSPRIGVAFPISDATNFRLSYGHFFQVPSFNQLYDGINTDFNTTNSNQLFGRPIPSMRSVQFEVGITHLFNPNTVFDITAYNKNKQADATFRIDNFTLPPSYGGPTDLRVLTNLDFGQAKGVDVRLTRRYGQYFTAILGYSYMDSKNTGSDPYSYVYSFGRFTDPVTGAALAPAQALQNTDYDVTHRFTIESTANFGGDVASGTSWNPLLKNTNLSLTFTANSGLPYTTSSTPGALGRGATGGRLTELQNSSRLPWTSNIDGRFTRGFTIAGSKVAAFLDVRNLLNTRTLEDVFGMTGSAVDPGDLKAAEAGSSAPTQALDLTTGSKLEQLNKQRSQQILDLYGLSDDDPATLSVQEQKNLNVLQYVNISDFQNNYGLPRRWRVGLQWTF